MTKIRISITLPEEFDTIVKDLTKLGYKPREMVTAGIRMLHKKEFPPYVAKKSQGLSKPSMVEANAELTEIEICEDIFGGEVMEENGIKYCKFKQNNFVTKIPLTAIKEQLK